MDENQDLIDSYLAPSWRKIKWFCFFVLAIGIVIHNVMPGECDTPKGHEFHLGTLLFGLAIGMFFSYYGVKRGLLKFVKGKPVYTIDMGKNTVNLVNKDTGVSILIPKERYQQSVTFQKNGLLLFDLGGSIICKADEAMPEKSAELPA